MALSTELECLGKWTSQIASLRVENETMELVLKDSGPLPIKFMNLKSLHLSSTTAERANQRRTQWVRWDTPSLEELVTFGSSEPHYPKERFLDSLLSSRIKRLTLEDHWIDEDQLYDRLMACPNLIELSLEGLKVMGLKWEPQHQYPLQSLQILDLGIWEMDIYYPVALLTRCFTFPSLKRVTFKGNTMNQQFAAHSIRQFVSNISVVNPPKRYA